MAFDEFSGFKAGMRTSADRLNSGDLIGRVVFQAFRDAAQTIATSTVGVAANALSWDNISLDLLGGWSAANPTRFTPPIAGWYKLTGGASLNSSATGEIRGSSWLVNGALIAASTGRVADNGEFMAFNARDIAAQFNGTTDYVELAPFQNSGVNQNTATGSPRPSMTLYYAGPLT